MYTIRAFFNGEAHWFTGESRLGEPHWSQDPKQAFAFSCQACAKAFAAAEDARVNRSAETPMAVFEVIEG